MEFRFRAGEEKEPTFLRSPPPPPLASSDFFASQAMQVGFIGFEGPMRPKPSLAELERELHEERIKEEIIARRIAQRRMLEEQVRREMEIEREMMMERFHEPIVEPLMLVRPHRRDVSFDERVPIRDSTKIEDLKKLPLVPMKSEAEIVNEINLPNKKLSGTKRKVACVRFPRPAQKDWSCALCQVSATCEEGLNDHLKGKKHLMKAAQLASSKKASAPAVVKNSGGCSGSSSNPKVAGSCSGSSSNPKESARKKKGLQKVASRGKKVSIQINGKMYQVVARGIHLWCWMCKIKCNSKEMMVNHLSGKKHLLEESKKDNKSEMVKTESMEKKETVEGEEEHVQDGEQSGISTDGVSMEGQ